MKYLVSCVETWKPSNIYHRIIEVDTPLEAIKKFVLDVLYYGELEEFEECYPAEETQDWNENSWIETVWENHASFLDIHVLEEIKRLT